MIWCVEDDESIRDIEVYTLKSTGYDAEGFCDGEALYSALRERIPQLIILDVMLPGEDGVEILEHLKSNERTADIPVIMATAKGAEYDKIISLDMGADDYLVKPFGMMEMVSRVRAVLRRTMPKSYSDILKCGEVELNMMEHSVFVKGEPVILTLKEFDLLSLFMSHPGMVFTRDRLLSDIWSMDYDGETRTVDVHIRTLRQKLGSCGTYIETVRGVGYRMGARNG
jgi:two-component system alkaline phosphatase synthesis response regulator PhoP